MATTKLDTAYSAFIMNVVPLLYGMDSQELGSLLDDITKRMYSEIDGAKESELYREAKEETQRDFMDEMRSDMQEEREVYDDDSGDTLAI